MFEKIIDKLLLAPVRILQCIVTILLAITPDRTFSKEVSERLRTRLHQAEGKQPVISTCCEAVLEVNKVGNEIFAVCSRCRKYVGHFTSRPCALLETNFEGLLAGALRERDCSLSLCDPEVRSVYQLYIQTLHSFAPQAARSALRRFMPVERVDKH